jgi:hypothetical protein
VAGRGTPNVSIPATPATNRLRALMR